MVSDKKHIILYNPLQGCMKTVHSIGADFIEDASETQATPINMNLVQFHVQLCNINV